MPAVSSVLVVGAGTAGTATAIFLARAGIAVDLVCRWLLDGSVGDLPGLMRQLNDLVSVPA